MKITILFLLISQSCTGFLFRCNCGKDTEVAEVGMPIVGQLELDSIETIMYPEILSLKKVNLLKEMYDSIVILTKEKPTDDSNYYQFQVAIDSQVRLQAVYSFYYDMESKRLFYYEPVSDELIDASAWDNVED